MGKKVSRVILNGETIMDIHEDSVNQDNLLQDETAHGSDGEPIIGRASIGGNYYSPNDPASTDLANDDYIPFNDVSDSETPKKKTLFSNIIDKLKQVFLSKSAESQIIEGRVLALRDRGIDVSKADNDVSDMTYPTMYTLQDKAGRNFMKIEAVVCPDGRIGFNSYVRNYDTNGDQVAQKGIRYYMNKSGSLQYTLGDGEAFNAAVGFGYAVGTISGSAITAALSGFVLITGGIVILRLDSAMPVNATLNVNNTGAKSIHWFSTNNVRAKDIPTTGVALWTLAYDGTYWRILSVNKTPTITPYNYVANTSGDLRLETGYDQNQFDLRYNLSEDKLKWNRYINGAWHGDKVLLDEESDLIIKTNQYLSTKVTSLDDIPLNTAGRVYLDASIDPLGMDREYVYICYGRSPFKTIELTRVVHTNKNTEEFWKNSNNGTDGWTGWLPLSRTGTYVGTCTTAADQQHKTATVDADFSLKKGVRVGVKYSYSNTYSSTASAPTTLNVNSTGDKQIYYNNAAAPTGTNGTCYGIANRYVFYIYDGTYWVWDGMSKEDNTTYPVITVEQIGAGSDTESRVVRADYLRSGIRYVMGSLDIVRLSYLRVKTVSIPDNSGYPKYLLLKDITTWYNSTEDEQLTQGYTGLIFDSRQGNGYTRRGITEVSAMVAYHKVTSVDNTALLLNTSNASTFIPVIMKDSSNKYYLALKTLGAGRLMTFLGRWINDGNANTDWAGYNGTWISCTDSSGTLPTGYSVVISNDSKMYDNTFLADADNKAFGIAFCASNSSSGATAITATSNRYVLKQGGFVTVYFQYAVPADATLNINGRGARNIIYAGANIKNNVIFAGDRATFIYDGTNYVLVTIDRAITGRTLMGTCTTAADQQNKVGTVDGDFVLRKGVRVGLKFSNTNTFSSQTSTPITLNVNSTGAKNIFYNQNHSGAGNTGTNTVAYGVSSRINYYVYDGTYWVWDGSSYDNNSDCRKAFYGTCSTEAATAAKVVTISDTSGWELRAGTVIGVKFTYSNTANNVTLNVKDTGAKSIYYNTSVYTGNSTGVCGYANRTTFYMYNGSQWVFLAQGVTNSDTYTSAYCSTAGGTAAKAATCSGYALASKSHLHIIMTAANTVKGAITLNVNGKGAKPIYINGSASSASNYTLPAGSYLIYYNGTNYYFRTDGKITCAGTVTV